MSKKPNILEQFQQEQLDKYMFAKATAPHPERDAYAAILAQRAQRAEALQQHAPMEPAQGGGDQILASGPSPNGGVEMLVKKSGGVVGLLMPDMPQVKNTLRGPKMYKPAMPLELPLVRRTAPTRMQMEIWRLFNRPIQPALLLFQGRFNTAAREINLW
jgi:hypothetical protein